MFTIQLVCYMHVRVANSCYHLYKLRIILKWEINEALLKVNDFRQEFLSYYTNLKIMKKEMDIVRGLSIKSWKCTCIHKVNFEIAFSIQIIIKFYKSVILLHLIVE